LTLVASVAFAKNGKVKDFADYQFEVVPTVSGDYRSQQQPLAATAVGGTTDLLVDNFDASPTTCTTEGWTAVDLSTVASLYFHVDDYALLPIADYSPIAGTKSLWCGVRAGPAVCQYEAAPGYGNNWDQTWTTKACLPVAGPLNLDLTARWNSHYSYCGWSIEYLNCAGGSWTRLEGGVGLLTDLAPGLAVDFDSVVTRAYAGVPASVKVRLRFQSQHAYSDEDAVYPTNGALHVDNLTCEGLATEDFEGEAVGATTSNDWEAGFVPGFGNFFDLFPGIELAQDDPCRRDLSCMWAAIKNSPDTYACGGKPAQKAVPKKNANDAYIHNEIWSPLIPLAGTTGSVLDMQFSVYRDMLLDNLQFYIWRIRQYDGGIASCPRAWHDFNFVYYSSGKDWLRHLAAMAPLVDLSAATHIQVGLGVLDNCRAWCGIVGSGACHSHAPLFDTVRVYRVDLVGPQWTIRDLEQFQDNFAETLGPWAGTARADAGNSIRATAVPGVDPGDSSLIFGVTDPGAGIAPDGAGGYKVYIYVATWPQGQTTKDGAAVTQDAASHPGASYPWVGSTVANGITWDCVRLQLTGLLSAGKFRIDLNDCLWEPCDTVCFFYCAENNDGVITYASGANLGLRTGDIDVAAANASEFTILPAGGWKNGGDILYVDGMDGRGAQPYFDEAFQSLGILDEVDRYDVRGPSSSVGNRPSTRIKDISQLLDCYQKIIWDCGDLDVGIGQGKNVGGQPAEKSPDYAMLNTFLDQLAVEGGVYLCGDDVPRSLSVYTEPQAVTFKTTYLTYTLTSGNHVAVPFPITPKCNGIAARCFTGDTFYAFGGCLLINDFDVMTPTGSTLMEVSYGAPAATNGAVLSKITTNSNAVDVGVLMSGFSFIYIRDDGVPASPYDPFDHMHDIITWLNNVVPNPTGTGTVASNSLSQNYPNPFNPQTTIAFSVKERGMVNLKVYNVAGQLVRTLANEQFAAGAHTKVWDGRNDSGQPVSSGVYFYKLVANNFAQTKKMVLLK
jgi:hypothetical protein